MGSVRKIAHMDFEIIRSKRKTLALEITRDLRVVVRAPLEMPERTIEEFIQQKRNWIEKHTQAQCIVTVEKFTPDELRIFKLQAQTDICQRVAVFAAAIGVDYGKISFAFQRTLWGSCSRGGNLRFNCLLMCTPDSVRDYIVVHELCHRKHMNHSSAFWAEVETVLPGYRSAKQWLKINEHLLIHRLP